MIPIVRAFLHIALFFFAFHLNAHSLSAQTPNDRAIIVFDASGSMWGQIDGKSKIEIARETLDRFVGALPQDLQLGMIAYGHNRKGDCSDIETMVNIGPASTTGQSIAQSVRRISPKGKTPLTEAVRTAAEQLRYTEDKASVILVTDGVETCNANPCALADQLEQIGVDFTAHVIAFDLSDEEGKQVACLAENTGGLYLKAGNADELTAALNKTVAPVQPAVSPVPEAPTQEAPEHNFIGKLALVEGGPTLPKESVDGFTWYIQPSPSQENIGRKHLLGREHEVYWSGSAGQYDLTVEYRLGGRTSDTITLDPYNVTEKVVALDAARVTGVGAFMFDSPGVDWAKLEWRFLNTDTKQGYSFYGYELDQIVPAGPYEISYGMRGEKATVNPPRSVILAAGEEKQLDFILPNTEFAVNVVEANGAPNTSIRQHYKILKDDGTVGATILYDSSAKPVFLRPGKYLMSIELWDGTKRPPFESEIEVGLGERTTFDVKLP
ncbi:MAG: VWA domain-containing protein [Roseibium sp.]